MRSEPVVVRCRVLFMACSSSLDCFAELLGLTDWFTSVASLTGLASGPSRFEIATPKAE